jgi:hypothetical protein
MANILRCKKHGNCSTAMIDLDVIAQMHAGKPPSIVRIPCVYRDPPSTLTISIGNFLKHNVATDLNDCNQLEDEFFS